MLTRILHATISYLQVTLKALLQNQCTTISAMHFMNLLYLPNKLIYNYAELTHVTALLSTDSHCITFRLPVHVPSKLWGYYVNSLLGPSGPLCVDIIPSPSASRINERPASNAGQP